ncbi:MAG: 1,6-anhydro-N-acetylmuramyl-L-alanine amidase AmpD [Pseudomonadota bacterium]
MTSLRAGLDDSTGALRSARQCPSPNADARPQGQEPELVVVHGISLPPGEFGGPYIDQLFCNRLDHTAHAYFESLVGLRVSAHALIRRDGTLVQYVPLHRRAWHAGLSEFDGRAGCNDFSIGFELEGCDALAYTHAQYRCLAALCRLLQSRWPRISRSRIVGHSDIAPGRKTDPGDAFDWSMLMREMDRVDADHGYAN